MGLSVYQVVQGIYEAIKNKHHGARDENGELVEIGLKREDQPITDQQVMDGFGVGIQGNLLMIRYHSTEPISNLHQKRFEKEVERRIEEIKKYIQKEFEKVTGSSLRLKEANEIKILVESSNRMKAIIKAMMPYEILNLKEQVQSVGQKSSVEKIKEMDAYYKKLAPKKRPPNDKRKAENK